MRKSKSERRATILLIVVSLLALLFVIITSFLTLSRNERLTLLEFHRGDFNDRILENQTTKALDAVRNQIQDANGKILSGPGAQPEDRPGGKSGFIALDPISSESVNLNPPQGTAEQEMDFAQPSGGQGWGGDYAQFKRHTYPQLSRLNPQAGDKPEAFPVWQLVFENERDIETSGNLGSIGRRFDGNDVVNAAREPAMDADGNGIPDSWWLYQISSIEEANAMAGTPVQLSGYFSDDGNPLNDLRPYSIPPANNAGTNAPLLDALHHAYVRYRETARYDVATMIKSHGGKITLYAPRIRDHTGQFMAPWNRAETERMFDLFRAPRDLNLPALVDYTAADRNYIFDQLAGSSAAVELSLRRRGGLAPYGSGLVTGPRPHPVPGILSLLQGDPGGAWRGFPETFVPSYRVTARGQPARANDWDRFNLAMAYSQNIGNDRLAAVRSAQVSATEQLEMDRPTGGGPMTLGSPMQSYGRRSNLTVNNSSDDIARKQIAGDAIPVFRTPSGFGNAREVPAAFRQGLNPQLQFTPTDPAAGNATQAARAGFTAPTYEGELKFPLTELAKGVVESQDRRYRWQRYDGTAKRGDALIERMARMYYDMISGHDGWDETGVTSQSEVLSRRQQAFHLAVNTASFMMPRSLGNSGMPGFIDVVTYQDGFGGPTYIGYGPQPYLSEVVACVKYEADERSNVRIAVEIFNPCDPYFRDVPATVTTSPSDWQGPSGQPYDVFALPAAQFAVSLTPQPPTGGGTFVGTILGSTAQQRTRINGRCFYTVVFNVEGPGRSNDAFENPPLPHSLTDNVVSLAAPQGEANVFLWKKGVAENADGTEAVGQDVWYLVDKIDVNIEVLNGSANSDGYWFLSRARDPSPNTQFGGFDYVSRQPGTSADIAGADTFKDTFARWNVVLPPLEDNDDTTTMAARSTSSPNGTLGNQRCYPLPGSDTPINPDFPGEVLSSETRGPTVPLVLMNAGPDQDNINLNPTLFERLNNLPMFRNRPQTGANAQQGDLRPRSFPTVGFMLFVPRYAHTITGGLRKTASEWLHDQWDDHASSPATVQPSWDVSVSAGGITGYPADIGHMPIFDNNQKPQPRGYFADTAVAGSNPAGTGPVPWGLLVFDYFTTLDPAAPGVDPLRVPGRINVNTAPWLTLSMLPVIGPAMRDPGPGANRIPVDAAKYMLPILRNWIDSPTRPGIDALSFAGAFPDVELFDPSPSFWDPRVGVLAGQGSKGDVDPAEAEADPIITTPTQLPPGDRIIYNSRLIHTDPFSIDLTNTEWTNVEWDRTRTNATRWKLGRWLAASAAAYRDGVQYIAFDLSSTNRPEYMRFADSHLRNAAEPTVAAGPGPRFRDLRGFGFFAACDDPTIDPNSLIRRYRRNKETSLGIGVPYGEIRGSAKRSNVTVAGTIDRPSQFGFISIGELLNVKGFDSTRHTFLPPFPDVTDIPLNTPAGHALTTLATGDFVKAVSLLALIDSQMLTTRSNTFTTYVSVIDRKQSENSVRAEIVIDRSNILPRLEYDYHRPPQNAGNNFYPLPDTVKRVDAMDQSFNYYAGTNATSPLDTPIRWTAPPGMKPNIIAEKRVGYYNARFDE